MKIRTIGKILVLTSTFWVVADANGQAGFDGGTPCARASRVDSEVRCDQNPGKAVVIEHDAVITTRLPGVTFQTRRCVAEIALSYIQNNTLASVTGEVENRTCGASSGSLVLSVRTVDENGEQATQEFTQTWMREDDQPVKFSADYPIGENVELARVRALRVQCTCAEAPPQGTAEAE